MRLSSPASRAPLASRRESALSRRPLRVASKHPAQAERRRRLLIASASKSEKGNDDDDAKSKKPDASASGGDSDDDAPPSLPAGAWRNFRASLVASAAVAAGEKPGPGGDIWSARWTPENVHLLQEQDRELAR
jgi:hypothetical protein